MDFIVHGADHLLQKHFGKTWADHNVQILDPATDTFVTNLINHLPADRREHKYRHEIHANEVAILPDYIANLNIEHTYQQRTGRYVEFPNLCFVDNLDWQQQGATDGAVTRQGSFNLGGLSEENCIRIQEQNEKPISVIIGNPPYNANQQNENDNNRNREYPEIDRPVRGDDQHLQELAESIRQTDMDEDETRGILVRAWEAAVQATLEDELVTQDEDEALAKYAHHSGLTQKNLDRNGAQTSLVQAAVIRDVTQGIVPQHQTITGTIPFNLMKSEQLVWMIKDVDYLETVIRRERRGASHGVSIRVVRGLYHRPSTFRSRSTLWEETAQADTGLLGLTTRHIYFAGSRKRSRVRYDPIVAFDPYEDGLGIMRNPQTTRPQAFRTGDGWFAYNLATNLAQNLG